MVELADTRDLKAYFYPPENLTNTYKIKTY
jgi:hypothetical protein